MKRPARGASYPFALWPVRTSLALRPEGQGSDNRSIHEMARPSRMVTSLGRARSAVRGRMVLDGVQSFEANQKLALASMERVGLEFSSRGSVRAVSSLLRE